jgi:hypothetical protein
MKSEDNATEPCGFYRNRITEGYTSAAGVNEITPVCTSGPYDSLKVNNALVKTCAA